ncbi:MAG: thermonuclease family protein [Phycisphaeraceae bacterium]|nr:thermonuclease family protein [Phycisphaeraceae bacterium]
MARPGRARIRLDAPSRRWPLTAYVLRKSRLRATLILAGLLVLGVLIVLDRRGLLLAQDDDWSRYQGRTFLVHHVIDGDTIDIERSDGSRATTRIRLWAVDCPEMPNAYRDTPAEPWANEATELTRKRCDQQPVTLHLQQHRMRDRYGRLLAFVTLPDGQTINEELVLAGLARVDRRFAHDLEARYDMLEQTARQQRVGLWSRESTHLPKPDEDQ